MLWKTIMSTNKANDEAEIRRVIDGWVEALRVKDVDAIMSLYAPDILLFDILPPLEHKGQDAYRKIWDMWVRATICYRKVDGRWMIAHDHHSVPVNMETNQALFDLKP
jgi:ketosteroid isomerase-like protein